MDDLYKEKIISSAVKLTEILNNRLNSHHIVHFSEIIKNNASSYLELNQLYSRQENKLGLLKEHINEELKEKANKDLFTYTYYEFKNSRYWHRYDFKEIDELMPNNFFAIDNKRQTKILLNILDNITFRNSIVSLNASNIDKWGYFHLDQLHYQKKDKEFEFGWALEKILFRIRNSYLHHRYIYPLKIKGKYYGAFVFYSNDPHQDLDCSNEIINICTNELTMYENFTKTQNSLLRKYKVSRYFQSKSQRKLVDEIAEKYLKLSLLNFSKSESQIEIINYLSELGKAEISEWRIKSFKS